MSNNEWLKHPRAAIFAVAIAGFVPVSFADDAAPPSDETTNVVDELPADDVVGEEAEPEVIRTLGGHSDEDEMAANGTENNPVVTDSVTVDDTQILNLTDEEAQLAAQRNLDEAPAEPNVMLYNMAPAGESGAPAVDVSAASAGVTDYIESAGEALLDGIEPATDVAVSGEAQTVSAGAASGAESGQIRDGHLRAR